MTPTESPPLDYHLAIDIRSWANDTEALLRKLYLCRDELALLALQEPRRSVAIERAAKACVLLHQALAVTESDQRRARKALEMGGEE